jgi:HEAT repeat protein
MCAGRSEHPEQLSGVTRGELLVALSMSRHPSPELVDGLDRLANDPALHGQALLGLGSAAFRLQRENAPLARQILGLLQRHLDEAHARGSFSAAAVALRAFGNAGHPAMIGALEPYLTATQPLVRAAALRALRRVDTPEAERLLTASAASDRDREVRSAAQATLAGRGAGIPRCDAAAGRRRIQRERSRLGHRGGGLLELEPGTGARALLNH